nr:hypothetical protein [Tanacetum cinerariifolium]
MTKMKKPQIVLRRSLEERRQLLQNHPSCRGNRLAEVDELSMNPAVLAAAERFMSPEVDKDVVALENEMWEKFAETGFWRSPSRKEETATVA